MAKKSNWMPRWLRPRALLGAEAALVVGVLMELSQRAVMGGTLPPWGKTLFLMGVNMGLLGALLLFANSLISGTLQKVFDTVDGAPQMVVHGLAFSALFLLYAHVWSVPVFGR